MYREAQSKVTEHFVPTDHSLPPETSVTNARIEKIRCGSFIDIDDMKTVIIGSGRGPKILLMSIEEVYF